MAKTRSPEYPAIGLPEAIEKAKLVFDKDYQNRLPKNVIAAHMGYKSLSGASLPILAALNKYGLLEGRGDETRISDRALAIIAHEPGSKERITAIEEAAAGPELFAELNSKFPNGKASDAAIRAYLLTEKFIPAAADTAIRSYRETKELVEAELVAYNKVNPEAAFQVKTDMRLQEAHGAGESPFPRPLAGANSKSATQKAPIDEPVCAGMRREVITLDEGDVVITFPDDLSAESFGDLKDYLDLFVKKMQRRAKSAQRDEAAD